MKVLKGFGLGVFGFLLFIGLLVFSSLFWINSTLLNPNFVNSEIEKLNIASVAKDVLASELPPESSAYNVTIEKTVDQLKPWISQQTRTIINTFYGYLLGKSTDFKVTIQLDQAKTAMKNNFIDAFRTSPPPQLAQATQQQRDQFISDFEREFEAQFPSSFTLDRSAIGADASEALRQAREIISYIQTAYIWLIGLIVLLIASIVLIWREVRGSSLQLGIIFLVSGIGELVGFLIFKAVLGNGPMLPPEVPASLKPWLMGLFIDLAAPLLTLAIVMLALGIILIAVSLIYRPGKLSKSAA